MPIVIFLEGHVTTQQEILDQFETLKGFFFQKGYV
ncbi:MAG: hypothetical protein CM15mP120_16460 [Pseudomonadota bacterium]|nr:MAG: hypothetical protein CM15mP120_16460 [Pseudomonadota bacterium]